MNPEKEESLVAGNPEPQRRYRVIADYQAEFPDPISVSAGETFQVSEKVSLWNDNPDWIWTWCTNQRGKSGWVPKNVISHNSDSRTAIARSTYSARELTVAVGEELVAHQEESGWLWCTNQQGEWGWVPLEHVTSLA